MNLVECEENLDDLSTRYDSLMDNLIAERSHSDAAQRQAEEALNFLEGHEDDTDRIALSLIAIRCCVADLRSRYKEAPDADNT